MSRCIIVSNGIITDYSYYKAKLLKNDYIICADGGIKHVIAMNTVPDLWLGDFDSCKFDDYIKSNPKLSDVERITLNPIKDETDTHYACIEAVKRGYNNIVIWGACGGRLDHMLSNINILEFLNRKNVTACIQDEKNTIRICNSTIDIKKEIKYLSILPLDSKALISKTQGLKYPLCNSFLYRDTSLGVSNEITGHYGSVSVESGIVLIIESDD